MSDMVENLKTDSLETLLKSQAIFDNSRITDNVQCSDTNKPVLGVYRPHKPGCTAREAG